MIANQSPAEIGKELRFGPMDEKQPGAATRQLGFALGYEYLVGPRLSGAVEQIGQQVDLLQRFGIAGIEPGDVVFVDRGADAVVFGQRPKDGESNGVCLRVLSQVMVITELEVDFFGEGDGFGGIQVNEDDGGVIAPGVKDLALNDGRFDTVLGCRQDHNFRPFDGIGNGFAPFLATFDAFFIEPDRNANLGKQLLETDDGFVVFPAKAQKNLVCVSTARFIRHQFTNSKVC